MARAGFGNVRKLPSGRWQARYPDETGAPTKAGDTFATKADAQAHLAMVRADRARGTYVDPRRGATPFGDYARRWIESGGSRGRLAPRTVELYDDLLAGHLEPEFGALALNRITADRVRDWHSATRRALAKRNPGRPTKGESRLRQAYALLRAIMATAEGEDLIAKNPCRVKGAGVAKSAERPHLDLASFSQLVEAHPADLRPVLALAFGAHLRLGEVVGLQRRDLDLKTGTLTVERQVQDTREHGTVVTSTKTEGRRVVDLPAPTLEVMRDYLASAPKALPGAPLFVRSNGKALTRAMLTQAWAKARREVGLEQFHFHDLRHAGLTLSAQSGATLRELMARAGHSTAAAAMVYQRAAEERGKVVAAGMAALMTGDAQAR